MFSWGTRVAAASAMRAIALTVGTVTLLAVANASTESPFVARFIPLGELPGGIFYSEGLDVTPGGTAAVGTSVSHTGAPGEVEAFRWTRESGIAGLGYPVPGYSQATAISADGDVVAGFESTATGVQAFRWTALDGRVPLSGMPAGSSSFSTDMSADGFVVAGYSFGNLGGFHAFRWTSGTGPIPLISNDIESFTTGMSADGTTIVGYDLGNNTPFRWTQETGAVGFGKLPRGYSSSLPHATSADGSVVVGYLADDAGNCQGYRWTSGKGFKRLGSLQNKHSSCNVADAVSPDGGVIGGSSAIEDESGTIVASEATIWTRAKGLRRLQDILRANAELNLAGWTLYGVNAIAVDHSSLTLVGSGLNPGGHVEAWLAVLPSAQRIVIDIRPNSLNNTINVRNGTVPVAILSTPAFDAPSNMDWGSIRFGRTGYKDTLSSCKVADVNADRLNDLLCSFQRDATDFRCRDREGILRGETRDGNPLEGVVGTDAVEIVCKR